MLLRFYLYGTSDKQRQIRSHHDVPAVCVECSVRQFYLTQLRFRDQFELRPLVGLSVPRLLNSYSGQSDFQHLAYPR